MLPPRVHELLPVFVAWSPVSSFANNAVQLVIDNDNASQIVLPLLVLFAPDQTAAAGALPGVVSLRTRRVRTTAPSGTGGITPVAHDSADALPAGVTAWNKPSTIPAGGTTHACHPAITPQPDELKLTTLDAPTMINVGDFGAQKLYDYDALPMFVKPLILREDECLELVQGGTGGTGAGYFGCIFAVDRRGA